jgi:hypothetical protein
MERDLDEVVASQEKLLALRTNTVTPAPTKPPGTCSAHILNKSIACSTGGRAS